MQKKRNKQQSSRPHGYRPAAIVIPLGLTKKQEKYTARAVGISRAVYSLMVASHNWAGDYGHSLWPTPMEMEKALNQLKKDDIFGMAFETKVSKFVAKAPAVTSVTPSTAGETPRPRLTGPPSTKAGFRRRGVLPGQRSGANPRIGSGPVHHSGEDPPRHETGTGAPWPDTQGTVGPGPDAAEVADQAGTAALRSADGDGGAGVRADQTGPRVPAIPVAGFGKGQPGVVSDGHWTQPAEAVPVL